MLIVKNNILIKAFSVLNNTAHNVIINDIKKYSIFLFIIYFIIYFIILVSFPPVTFYFLALFLFFYNISQVLISCFFRYMLNRIYGIILLMLNVGSFHLYILIYFFNLWHVLFHTLFMLHRFLFMPNLFHYQSSFQSLKLLNHNLVHRLLWCSFMY